VISVEVESSLHVFAPVSLTIGVAELAASFRLRHRKDSINLTATPDNVPEKWYSDNEIPFVIGTSPIAVATGARKIGLP
jgi:hypothetical protein